jgi:hypothetical protein
VEYCGVAWEDGWIAFDENPTPTTPASAAPTRRPIESLPPWHHRTQLKRLAAPTMIGRDAPHDE